VNDEVRRPRPGFISDAEDMLHDFDEIDRLNEGKPTSVEDVNQVIAGMK
jgi:hypothetical protein